MPDRVELFRFKQVALKVSYLRQRQRIPATGKIRVTLSPGQRDLLLATKGMPRDLGHLLHRAPVKKKKLEIRLGRQSLLALITAVLAVPTPDNRSRRALDVFLRYLEDLEERFDEPEMDALPKEEESPD